MGIGPLVTARRSDGIATVTMCDPASANALSEPMVAALTETFAQLAAQPDVAVLLLAAEGDTFSSGAPRELLLALAQHEREPADIRLAGALLAFPAPVIAVMEGHAVGGGLALGLAADVAYFASESRYGLPFLSLGFTPGMGTTRLMEHMMLAACAHELLYSGELRRGAELTGVEHVAPRNQLMPRALDLARRIASHPPAAVRMLKQTLSLKRRMAFEESHVVESLMHRVSFRDPAVRQRIEAEYVG